MHWNRQLLVLAFLCSIADSSAPCGGSIFVDHNTPFYSPNYPNSYSPNSVCDWIIMTRSNTNITLTFTAFELENCDSCGCDYLKIHDGSSSSKVIGNYCGSSLPPIIKSTGTKLVIKFKSDRSNEGSGFVGFFNKGTRPTYCSFHEHACKENEDICISLKKLCDGEPDCPDGSDETNCGSCQISDLRSPNAEFPNCLEETTIRHIEAVNVTCMQGHYLISERSVRCLNSNWTSIPHCVPSCSYPNNLPANIQMISSYAAYFLQEETAFLQCLDGYFVSEGFITSQLMITCKGYDMWTPSQVRCYPEEHFQYIYRPQREKIILATVGDTLELPCSLSHTTLFKPREVGITFSWFKNGLNLENHSSESFTITAEGNLILQNFTSENSGRYICLKKNQSLYIDTSNETYIVKVQPKCLPLVWNSTIAVHQNMSVLMFCPFTGFEVSDSPTWINRNGERIFNNDRFSLVANFGLLLNSVRYLDQGTYICDLGPNTPFCERQFATNLQVIPNYDDICGLTSQSGGFPWLVTLWWDDEIAPFCYGTLVNDRWVVTAASCLIGVHRKRNPGVSVKLGQQNSHDTAHAASKISVEYAKIHPQYSRRIHKADIGIVKLKQRVIYRSDIIPICLSGDDGKLQPNASPCEPAPPLTGNVSGLGSLEADLMSPESECMLIPIEKPCPSTPEGVSCAQSCGDTLKYASDIGSPFQVMSNSKVYLYGIFSWGERRAKETEFDYFTVVYPYYKWIASYIHRRD